MLADGCHERGLEAEPEDRPGRFGIHHCATCRIKHGPCEICDNNDRIPTICPTCRARPENAGWVELREVLRGKAREDDDAVTGTASASPARRPPTLLQRRILDLMTNYGLHTAVRRRVRRNGQRVWVWRNESRSLRYQEVAFLVGCSFSYCRKVYQAIAG